MAIGLCGDEYNPAAVGRERGLVVIRGIVRQLIETRSGGVNAIQIGRSAAFRRKNDPIALGRPRRIVVD